MTQNWGKTERFHKPALTGFVCGSAWAVEKTFEKDKEGWKNRQSTEKWCPSRQVSGGATGLRQLTIVLFTALHGMQTRSSDENSVCLSVRLYCFSGVCPSVCLPVRSKNTDQLPTRSWCNFVAICVMVNPGSDYISGHLTLTFDFPRSKRCEGESISLGQGCQVDHPRMQ